MTTETVDSKTCMHCGGTRAQHARSGVCEAVLVCVGAGVQGERSFVAGPTREDLERLLVDALTALEPLARYSEGDADRRSIERLPMTAGSFQRARSLVDRITAALNGSTCDKCGAGSWGRPETECEHDVLERHEYGRGDRSTC